MIIPEKVAIVGSRSFPAARLFLVRALVSCLPNPGTMIVSGGADGVDTVAEDAARMYRLPRMIFEPMASRGSTRDQYLQAIFERNCLIVEAADRLEVFWDGKSKGTKHVIETAMKSGKPFQVRGP